MASNRGHKVSEEERDFNEMKNKACEYYNRNEVPQQFENVLNDMFFAKPDDIYGYMANFFMKLSALPRICGLHGREIYDAQGELSVQAEVMCTIRNEQKPTSSAGVPTGDGQRGPDVAKAKAHHVGAALLWINGPLNELLKGRDPCDQMGVDQILGDFFSARHQENKETRRLQKEEEENKEAEQEVPLPPPPPAAPSKGTKAGAKALKGASAEKRIPPCVPQEPEITGSVAVGAVSLAVAKSGALLQDVPLYKHIHALSSQVISTALQIHGELMRITNSTTSKAGAGPSSEEGVFVAACERPEQALDLVAEACGHLGLTLGEDVRLAVDCAAHRLMDYSRGKYEVMAGGPKSPEELVDLYQALLIKYPAVVALIQPFRKEDVDQWERLKSVIGASCNLLCDMSGLTASQAPPPALPGVKGQVLQHLNGMTVSDLIRITKENLDAVILSSSLGEPCGHDCLSDLAVGLGVAYVRLGGLQGAQRLAKYNRLIAIEEELAQHGILVSQSELPALLRVEDAQSDASISEGV